MAISNRFAKLELRFAVTVKLQIEGAPNELAVKKDNIEKTIANNFITDSSNEKSLSVHKRGSFGKIFQTRSKRIYGARSYATPAGLA